MELNIFYFRDYIFKINYNLIKHVQDKNIILFSRESIQKMKHNYLKWMRNVIK